MKWLVVLFLTLLAVMGVSMAIGPAGLTLMQIVDGLCGGEQRVIVRDLRLPRALLALATGGLLALSGTLYQTLFRNPLADPFVVGISGGAALGAVIATVLKLDIPGAPSALAFLGATGTMLLVYRLALTPHGLPIVNLLLCGFAAGTFLSSLVAIVLVMNRASWDQVMGWLLGSLALGNWKQVAVTAPVLVATTAPMLILSRHLDILSMGEEGAHTLGVDVEASKRALFFVATLATAVAVSVCGIVGFVGLVAPHVARGLVGPRHALVLPAAVLIGGILMGLADIGSRLFWALGGVPLSAVAALFGAPFFVYLVRRSR